ncbi:MAG: HAMP domain-containing protein [Alphaproteobacteria bacterium]|nr:MAG: HAMP domain-containing protein [Alphaproteobacteria bacterium]
MTTARPEASSGAGSLAGPRRKRVFPILFVQILAANLAVAGAVTLLLYWTFQRLTDTYFHRLMEEFNISPTKLNSMFVEDVERSLVFGIGLALAIGLGLSFLLTKALLRPLAKMARTTEKIAAGDFSARAPALKGELGALAWHFNAMAHALEREEIGRRQLLRDLSHELRTPLTNLKGYIEGIQDGVFEANEEVLAVLNDEVRRINFLVDDLATLSTAEELESRLDLAALDLRAELATAISAHKGALMEHRIALEVRQSGRPVPVRADPKRLHQVFSNALANLVQYSTRREAGGSGETEAYVLLEFSVGGPARICFANPAAPVSQGDLKRLFDRFVRLDDARAASPGKAGAHNAGLGLSIVKRLVEAQGGSAWAEYRDGDFQLWFTLPTAGGGGAREVV